MTGCPVCSGPLKLLEVHLLGEDQRGHGCDNCLEVWSDTTLRQALEKMRAEKGRSAAASVGLGAAIGMVVPRGTVEERVAGADVPVPPSVARGLPERCPACGGEGGVTMAGQGDIGGCGSSEIACPVCGGAGTA